MVADMPLITCGKTRDSNDPSKRTVVIQVPMTACLCVTCLQSSECLLLQDGDAAGKNIVIVDDLVQVCRVSLPCVPQEVAV